MMSDNTSCQGTNPVSEGGVSGEYTYTRARFSPILSDSNSSENGSGCSGRCYDSDQNADCFEAGGTSHAILPNSDERDGNETGTSIYPQGQTHDTVYDSSNDTTIQVWFLASRIPTPRQEADEGVSGTLQSRNVRGQSTNSFPRYVKVEPRVALDCVAPDQDFVGPLMMPSNSIYIDRDIESKMTEDCWKRFQEHFGSHAIQHDDMEHMTDSPGCDQCISSMEGGGQPLFPGCISAGPGIPCVNCVSLCAGDTCSLYRGWKDV